MTRRNEILILSSILLALLVIASAILLVINSAAQNSTIKEPVLVTASVILVSVLSVVVVYFTKVKKRKYEKLLNQAYFQKYEIIKDAVGNSQLSNSRKVEIREEILDMLLLAQEAGKPVESVISNPDEFSQEMLQAYARPIRLTILTIFDSFIALVLIIIGTSTFLWLEQTTRSFFDTRLEISMVALFILVAFVVLPVTRKQTSKQNPWMYFIPLASGVIFVLLAEMLRAYLYDLPAVQVFLDGTLQMVPNAGILIIYLFSIPFLLLLKRVTRRIHIRS